MYISYIALGRSGYVIRIINQLSTNRGLLKGFTGSITDVTFAHASSDYLAAIDQGGNLYVWKLEETSMEVKYPSLLNVMLFTREGCTRFMHCCYSIISKNQALKILYFISNIYIYIYIYMYI